MEVTLNNNPSSGLDEAPVRNRPIACGLEEIAGACGVCFHDRTSHTEQGFCVCQAIEGSTPCWRRGRSE